MSCVTRTLSTAALLGALLAPAPTGQGKQLDPSLLGPGRPAPILTPPRAPAEWEPTRGLLVSYPLVQPDALIVEAARDDELFVLVKDAGVQALAEADFQGLGIDLERVQFIEYTGAYVSPAFERISDWGPVSVFDGTGRLLLADPIFLDYPWSGVDPASTDFADWMQAAWAANDDATKVVAPALNTPRIQLRTTLTVGNLLVDGRGTAFTTDIQIAEVEHHEMVTVQEFFEIADRELGFSRFHVLPNYEPYGVQHVTVPMKLLDEERALVARVPVSHPGYAALEAFVDDLSQRVNVFGRPYEILRLDCPTYLNTFFDDYLDAIILNEKVLVPFYGDPVADQNALATWQDAMPGYAVFGFEYPEDVEAPYKHTPLCRSLHIFDPGMLYMSHRRIAGVVAPSAAGYEVEVLIRDYSRAGLVAGELALFWRPSGATSWNEVALVPGKHEHYVAAIPGPAAGEAIEYYLSAADHSGRQECLPPPAPAGFYTFEVGE